VVGETERVEREEGKV
jgi:hypothetical protein